MKKFLNKVRGKLFLNAMTRILEEKTKILQEENAAFRSEVSDLRKELYRVSGEISSSISSQIYLQNVKIGEICSKIASAQVINRETFLPYKNFGKDKSIVICGAGPSLQNYVPFDSQSIHIALNRAFLYEKAQFDFVFVQDFDGIRLFQDELIEYRKESCVKLFAYQYGKKEWNEWLYKKNTPEQFIEKCGGKRFVTDIFYQNDLYDCDFIPDIAYRPVGNFSNVALDCLQFALYMNPKKIYLVGLDCSGNHFVQKDGADDEDQTEYWEKTKDWTLDEYVRFKEFANQFYPDTQIISVNPVGLKGVFTDWYQSEK